VLGKKIILILKDNIRKEKIKKTIVFLNRQKNKNDKNI
jgi:hypothetical protein